MTLETQVLSWNRYINMVELNRSVGPNTALFITGSPTEIHIHSPKKICTDSLPLNITLCTSMVSETLLICSLVAERRFYGLFSFFFCDHRIRSQNTIRVTVPQQSQVPDLWPPPPFFSFFLNSSLLWDVFIINC